MKKLKIKNGMGCIFYAIMSCKALQNFNGTVLYVLIDFYKDGKLIRQSKIAEKLNSNQSYVSKVIKKLVDMGLINKYQERMNRTAEYNLNIEKINETLGGRYLEVINGNCQSQADSTTSTDVNLITQSVEDNSRVQSEVTENKVQPSFPIALTNEKEEEDELVTAFNEHNDPTYDLPTTDDEKALSYWKNVKKEKTYSWIDFQQQFQNMYEYQKRKGIEEDDMIAVGNIHQSIPYDYLNWAFRYWLRKKMENPKNESEM